MAAATPGKVKSNAVSNYFNYPYFLSKQQYGSINSVFALILINYFY